MTKQVAFEVVITSQDPPMSSKKEAENLKDIILDGLGYPDSLSVNVIVRVVPLVMEKNDLKDWV